MEDRSYFKISIYNHSQIIRNVYLFVVVFLVWLIYWSVEYITPDRFVALCGIATTVILWLFFLQPLSSIEWLLLEMDGELTLFERDKAGRLTTRNFDVESANWLFGFVIRLKLKPSVASGRQNESLLIFRDQVSKPDWCRIRRCALRQNNG